MEADRKPISLPQNALAARAQKKHITDYFEKRSFPLVSRAKHRVRQIREIVSLAIGPKRCRKFTYA